MFIGTKSMASGLSLEFLISVVNLGHGLGVREGGRVTLGGGPRVDTSLEFKPAAGERNTGEAAKGEAFDLLPTPGKNASAHGFNLELTRDVKAHACKLG